MINSLITEKTVGALCIAAVAALLGGCAAFTSTTNTAAEAAETIAHGVSKASQSTSDASVTEPDTPRYAQAVAFVDSQRDPLEREAAVGGGEHIDTLAQLLNAPGQAPLGPWLQTHYESIFAGGRDAAGVVDAIRARRS